MDSQKNRSTERQTNRQTVISMDKQTDRFIDRKTDSEICIKIGALIRSTGILFTDRQTDRQSDRHTASQTNGNENIFPTRFHEGRKEGKCEV